MARLWVLTAGMTAAAVGLLAPIAFSAPGRVDGVWLLLVIPLLLVGFGLAEAGQVHFDMRRLTWSLSLSEVPLVVGLFIAPPLVVVACRLLGYLPVAVKRRTVLEKGVFNSVLFMLEVSLAEAIYHLLGVPPATSTAGWSSAYAAALGAALISGLAVGTAIAVTQPPLRAAELARLVGPTVAAACVSTTVGLLVVAITLQAPISLGPLVALVVLLLLAFRRYGALLAEHRTLADVHTVTAAVATSLDGEGSVDPSLLERVRTVLRAREAVLWLTDESLASVVSEGGAFRRETSEIDPIRERALTGGALLATAESADPDVASALTRRGVRQVIAVPLLVSDAPLGTLEVQDRSSELATFSEADRDLLGTLAAQLGVALENRRLLARLRHEAQHDPLTGLPNRRAFVDRLDADLALLPPGGRMAVLVLDLQAFKDVNDALGRGVADLLLVEVGARVRGAVADPRAVARLSSDELAVAAPVQDADEARAVALRLQEALSAPVDAGGVGVHLGAVVGIALSPDHGRDAVTLCQHADVAMYAAKGTGRGVLTYTPTMDAGSVRRVGLVPELRRALAGEPSAGRIVPWYQPQVSLERAELVGVEALVRWEHPEEGLLAAGEFVPLAERTGLIGRLTTSVLEASLADLRRWVDAGHTFGVSVNVSVRSLLDPGFADEVTHAIAAAGVPAHLVTLEITETGVVSDLARTVPVLTALRSLGVRLSVDDFGTGQSSLTYLRRLPVSEVKVDRSFVAGLVHEPGDLAVVRAVVDLSRPLGLTVVAEGVETEEARELLREVGCTVAQGYLLSRPLTAEDLERWMQRRTVSVPGTGGGRARRLRVVS
ncbi:MAG: putative bifunctional diguanylate cyclase/phosphodiesterase [Motilibacteraceae bacterium]